MGFFNKPKALQRNQHNDRFKPVDLRKNVPMTTPKGIIKNVKMSANPHLLIDVTMYLRNGDKTQFIALMDEGKNSFTYNDSTYIVDEKALVYNLGTKLHSAVYHEELSLPMIQTIPVTKIKEAIEEEGITDIDNAIDPFSLRRFMESNIIQNAMQGVEMMKLLSFMKTLLLVILIVVAVLLLKYLGDTGAFSSITG